ncbi:MAG: DUF5681 domain-containing protein [Sinimarinibacterium flocculans]|uniref:DUF5681 domain-containing protein n=1 Tax=Sinimarinibacterium flocculans TaxID=985250 RepID=UPI003C3E95F4
MAERSRPKQRGPGKPWKAGESGNPKGRPPGSGPSAQLREAINKDLPEIVEALAKKAKEGDAAAAKVLLAKCLPDLRAEAASAMVPGFDTGTIAERAQAALEAAGRGELPMDLAAAMVTSLGALVRIKEFDELEARLRALEAVANEKR